MGGFAQEGNHMQTVRDLNASRWVGGNVLVDRIMSDGYRHMALVDGRHLFFFAKFLCCAWPRWGLRLLASGRPTTIAADGYRRR